MNILVVGSLKNVPCHAELCGGFVARLGETIVERDHTLLTGCRGSVDKAISEAAYHRLEALKRNGGQQLIGYRLKDAEPAYRLGTVRISSLKDWDLTHPELSPPEQIANADAAIFVAGSEGTFIAANWARIAGIPVLGVAQFGGAGEIIFESEYRRFDTKYSGTINKDEFEVLSQDVSDVGRLANDVVHLAERIVMPRSVFPILPFTEKYRDVLKSWKEVCAEIGFEVRSTGETESTDRIIPKILEGIRHSAFLIADITEVRPNVFYEIGFAQGLGKQVVFTAKTNTKLPFDLTDVPVIFWHTQEGLKQQLRKRLTSVLRGLRRSSFTTSS